MMNITDLYLSGVSRIRTRLVMNPLRRIFFKILRPYLDYLIFEINKQHDATHNKVLALNESNDLILENGSVQEKHMEALNNRFNTVEESLISLNTYIDQVSSEREKDLSDKCSSLELSVLDHSVVLIKRGEYISEQVRNGKTWDKHIIDLATNVASNRSGIAIDIGGHFGFVTIALSNLFSKVYTFEPNTFNYNILKANLALNSINNVVTHNHALYSTDTELSLSQNEYQEVPFELNSENEFDGLSSSNLGAYSFRSGGSGLFLKIGRTLDSFQLENVDFIKIDVQGADGEVIIGALSTIAMNLPVIVFEWEDELSKNYSIEFEQIEKNLLEIGYRVEKLYVHNDKQVDYVGYPPNYISK